VRASADNGLQDALPHDQAVRLVDATDAHATTVADNERGEAAMARVTNAISWRLLPLGAQRRDLGFSG